MFEIGFPELILIAVVGLLVIGPERLPEALRTLGLWVGRVRRSFTSVKAEIEKEIGMDEIRRQLHNEAVMEEMKRIERDVRDSVNAVSDDGSISAAAPAGRAGDAGTATDNDAPTGTGPVPQSEVAPEDPDQTRSGTGDEGRG